jgi:hypothetical protein
MRELVLSPPGDEANVLAERQYNLELVRSCYTHVG